MGYEAARKAERKNRRSGISSDQLTQDVFRGFAGEAASSFNREKSESGSSESGYMEQMLDDMCLPLPSTSCTTMEFCRFDAGQKKCIATSDTAERDKFKRGGN